MIDPIQSIALSMQANPGVYALLLGSGVSRAAGILTGWEITLDLIRKLARMSGESCEPTPEVWYRNKYGQEPDYSELLDQLVRTPAERQQLLRSYFEPTEQEQEEGLNQPTSAHRAIAQLAADGFVKVIVTTNFDRLLETAFSEVNVVPTVLSTPDQVKGALPLIHTRHCVLKIHGDYLDTRILNTPAELDEYSQEFSGLLDQIFNEFGLVVCGWSADWDTALCNALYRAPSRRFTTFWTAHRGHLGDQAQRLIEHRQAQTVPIESAESFFRTVQERVESLREFSRPHPPSTEAVTSVKRYLSEPRYTIQLGGLIDDTVESVVAGIAEGDYDVNVRTVDGVLLTERLQGYEALCSTLVAMGTVGGRWSNTEHCELWQRGLRRLSETTQTSGNTILLGLQYYPAALLLYALGIGAVDSDRLEFLGRLFSTDVRGLDDFTPSIVSLLTPARFFEYRIEWMKLLRGMERRRAPISDWMHNALREPSSQIVPGDEQYTFAFDKFEVLMALNFHYRYEAANGMGAYFPNPGGYVYRTQNRNQIIGEMKASLTTLGDSSPFVVNRLYGENSNQCMGRLDAFEDSVRNQPWR